MHRHGYVGRKLSRKKDQRTALIKGLATSLVMEERIETTLPKAKELDRYIEKLITKAKKGDLASRRAVIAGLSTQVSAFKLVDEIAPKLNGRTSGHVRVERTRLRVGDGAQMAIIEFVDELSNDQPAPIKAQSAKEDIKESSDKKAPKAPAPKIAPQKQVAQDKHLSHKPTVAVRKSGER